MSRTTVSSWLVAALVVLAAGTAGALSGDSAPVAAVEPVAVASSPPAAPLPSASALAVGRPPLDIAQLATVKLTVPCGADLTECAYGSGSIVDSSGLILTNAHVAAPASPGLGQQYSDLEQDVTNPDHLVVSVVPQPEADAVPRYRATVVAVDGYADLAVLRVSSELDGSPLGAPVVLDNVPLAALNETRKDAEIRVIGFPESGSSLSPTVQRGTIASKPVDPNGRVAGPWELNTGAPIHGGNSGGLVIDAQGRLIAIPTYSRGLREQTYRARAVELARPLLAAARAGKPYVSPSLVKATGLEMLAEALWSGEQLPSTCVEPGDVSVFDVPEELAVQVALTGLTSGEDYRLVVTGPDGGELASRQSAWTEPDCIELIVETNGREGTYTLTAYAGPEFKQVGARSIVVVDDAP